MPHLKPHPKSAHEKPFRPSDYALLWFFAIAAAVGVIGTVSIARRASVPAVVIAPTVDEYHAAAVAALAPFLEKASAASAADFGSGVLSELAPVVDSAQAKLLGLRVPGSEREAHLAFILALERWKRALGGDVASDELAISQLRDALVAYPWAAAAARSL